MRYPGIRCVVTAEFGSIHHAVRALKRGATDYLIKPLKATQVIAALTESTSQVAATTETQAPTARVSLPSAPPAFDRHGIVGESPVMETLFMTLERVAPLHSSVLIQGETGTGKDLIARTLHANSPRRGNAFVAFNAAAIPDGLAEAELFGHVKGAFTGAVATRVGRFEAADGGTLFIDEVSSMSMGLQAKLLRALQEREVERVGTSRPIKINTRVIAASNVDLAEMVKAGTFREDLYYRLNVVCVDLPPLRARPEDIPALARYFLAESCRHNDLPAKTLTQSALQALMTYRWPGNVRHLQNAVEHAVAMSGPDLELTSDVLPALVRSAQPMDMAVPPSAELSTGVAVAADAMPGTANINAVLVSPAMPDEGINFASTMTNVERELILRYLHKAQGNKRQAARLLNLSRTTLIDKLNRLGVTDFAQAREAREAARLARVGAA
jgi:DNA-binding NtrC family response regulator